MTPAPTLLLLTAITLLLNKPQLFTQLSCLQHQLMNARLHERQFCRQTRLCPLPSIDAFKRASKLQRHERCASLRERGRSHRIETRQISGGCLKHRVIDWFSRIDAEYDPGTPRAPAKERCKKEACLHVAAAAAPLPNHQHEKEAKPSLYDTFSSSNCAEI
jgi:hypothetical protein